MKEDLNDPTLMRIVAAHPLVFRGKEPAVSSHVPDGWFGLVERVLGAIEIELGPEGCRAMEVRQVKEKFGALGIHVAFHGRRGRTNPRTALAEAKVRELIAEASEASETTCQVCGAFGEMRNLRGYMIVLCPCHHAEAEARAADA